MSEPYYKHLPKWPDFSWTDEEKANLPPDFKSQLEEIDGDLPTTRIDSWRDFHRLVEHERFALDEFIFRGQRGHRWDLRPSLARDDETGVFSAKQCRECLASFRRSSRGRKDLDPTLEDDLEMWALGQHHGLKTPLLDWTLSPYVALFFAFEQSDKAAENPSRVVYALNKTKVERRVQEILSDGDRAEDAVRIFQPTGDSNRRLLSQAGLFLAVPPNESVTSWILTNLGDDGEDMDALAGIIMKMHIANTEREECLRALHKMNIHHASLFPDLIGSSNYSNFELDVYKRHLAAPGSTSAPPGGST